MLLQPFAFIISTCCIPPLAAFYLSQQKIYCFLLFPSHSLLLNHIQYWYPQKPKLGTSILIFSLTLRSPRAKALFFRAILKLSFSKTFTMLWKQWLGSRTRAYPNSHCFYTLLCMCCNLLIYTSSWQFFTVSALVTVVVQDPVIQIF